MQVSQNRFQSALSNYRTARFYGAPMQLLVSDLWGADGTPGIAMPGYNGNWTYCDEFLDALHADIEKYDMTDGLVYEIWNEPDGHIFWLASEDQLGHNLCSRKEAFPGMPIMGLCTANKPSVSNAWYGDFYPFVLSNSSSPTTTAGTRRALEMTSPPISRAILQRSKPTAFPTTPSSSTNTG